MMEYPDDEESQRHLIEVAMTAAAFVLADIWRRYFEIGGHADAFELEAYMNGLLRLPVQECNLLAQAVNELIDEEPPLPRAPYRDPNPRPGGPFSAAGSEIGPVTGPGPQFDQVHQWLWRFPGSIPD